MEGINALCITLKDQSMSTPYPQATLGSRQWPIASNQGGGPLHVVGGGGPLHIVEWQLVVRHQAWVLLMPIQVVDPTCNLGRGG